MNSGKENLRTVVRGAYDIQKLRIQMGNRIVGNFKARLGQAPSEPEEELDDDAKKILADLRIMFRKITDGVKTFPSQKNFVGNELISDYTALCLVAQYIDLETFEAQHFRRLGNILKDYRIFNEFLDGVKGIGPAMAGVIISEIDISRATYVSSLWAYAGLDVVGGWEIEKVVPVSGELPAELLARIPQSRPLKGDAAVDGERFILDGENKLHVRYQWDDSPNSCTVVYKQVMRGGRSRRKEHLVEREYIDKSGKPATRVGITFNPFLKTKLTGVLASSFLRCKDSPYAEVYGNYKHRLESREEYKDGQVDEAGKPIKGLKGHRHNMAMRFMVKRFLADLYRAWRTIEGLPVAPEYHEAKLGHRHTG